MDLQEDHDRLERILLGQEAALEQVNAWLEQEHAEDARLARTIRTADSMAIDAVSGLPRERVFTTSVIRDLCVRYRLRFLPSGAFKGAVPPQAVAAARAFELRAGEELSSFHVMAPARRFRFGDADGDPLLFVRVGRDRYFLVHRWGADLSPQRAMLFWPLRTPAHLVVAVATLALVITLVIPTGLIARDADAGWWGAHRFLFALWTTAVVAAFTTYGWFAFLGRFSREAWNCRSFN